MLLAGAVIGVAFLTKMAQGLLVLPAFGLVYLVASPLRLRVRVGHLLAAAGALVVSAGWFIALVELWPASARPYIGGSTNNSLWELALGYNGLGRIFGATAGSGGGGGANVRRHGRPDAAVEQRVRHPDLLVAARRARRARRRPGRRRAGRRAPTAPARRCCCGAAGSSSPRVVFSFMSGTIHPYYSVALAPAIAAVVAVGGRRCGSAATATLARVTLAR